MATSAPWSAWTPPSPSPSRAGPWDSGSRPSRTRGPRWRTSPPVRPAGVLSVTGRAPGREQKHGSGQHGRHSRTLHSLIPSTAARAARRRAALSAACPAGCLTTVLTPQPAARFPIFRKNSARSPASRSSERRCAPQSQDPRAGGSPAISATSRAVSPSPAAARVLHRPLLALRPRHRHHMPPLRQHPRQRHLRRCRPRRRAAPRSAAAPPPPAGSPPSSPP